MVRGRLQHLVDDYGVDGFKLDAGDAVLSAHRAGPAGGVVRASDSPKNTEDLARVGLDFPLNEYRAMWKMAASRSRTAARQGSLLGGPSETGSEHSSPGTHGLSLLLPRHDRRRRIHVFQRLATIDQELVVRSAQVHALMPMMQFSVAPWRVLNAANLAIGRAGRPQCQIRRRDPGAARGLGEDRRPIVRSLGWACPTRLRDHHRRVLARP